MGLHVRPPTHANNQNATYKANLMTLNKFVMIKVRPVTPALPTSF